MHTCGIDSHGVIRMLYFFLLLLLALLFFPDLATAGAMEALRVCGSAVIPALFPFFLLSRLLSSYLPVLKRVPSYLPALLMSFLGGYPVGISTVVSLYEGGQISKSDAQRALRICNNSGPGFFVAVAGSVVLHDSRAGLLLYAIHVLSALLTASLWLHAPENKLIVHRKPQPIPFPQQFQRALNASCNAMLQVCGLVILFSVLLSLLRPLLPSSLLPLVSGSLELTSGILSLRGHPHAFLLCALFMSWGGLCVHMQAISLWQSAGLQCKGYLFHKFLHALLSAWLACVVRIPLLFLSTIVLFLLFSQIRKKCAGKKAAFAV